MRSPPPTKPPNVNRFEVLGDGPPETVTNVPTAPPNAGGSVDEGFRLVHARKAVKRTRPNDTPEKPNSMRKYIDRICKETEWAKAKLAEAAQAAKVSKVADLAVALQQLTSGTLVEILEKQASTMSDLVSELTSMDQAQAELSSENSSLKEEIASLRAVREKQEVRNAVKEAEIKVALAARQCKVADINVGSCITDRRQLVDRTKVNLRNNIRDDLKARYDAMISRASAAVIAKQPAKKTFQGKEAWVAPMLITMQDKEAKWEMEEILRKSNIHPAFHWPKDLIEPVKELRKVIVDMGCNPDTHYIRIRPEERDGSWQIRADTKVKEGNARFAPKVRWAIPPLDQQIRKTVKDWAKPIWIASCIQTNSNNNAEIATTQVTEQVQLPDFTEDDSVEGFSIEDY